MADGAGMVGLRSGELLGHGRVVHGRGRRGLELVQAAADGARGMDGAPVVVLVVMGGGGLLSGLVVVVSGHGSCVMGMRVIAGMAL